LGGELATDSSLSLSLPLSIVTRGIKKERKRGNNSVDWNFIFFDTLAQYLELGADKKKQRHELERNK